MQIVTIAIHGINPIMMHNVRLANPLEPIVQEIKAVSGKRKKTIEDHKELARLEFMGGLYYDEKVGPFIPGVAFHKALVMAARAQKLGTKVNSAVVVSTLKARLEYDGPRTPEELWDAGFYDQRMVTVDRARTLRTRPMFDDWSAEFELLYSPSDFDERTFSEIVARSGRVGLLDYRPVYGTFKPRIVSTKTLSEAAE